MQLNGKIVCHYDGEILKTAVVANVVDLEKKCSDSFVEDNSEQNYQSVFFLKLAMFASSFALKSPLGKPFAT